MDAICYVYFLPCLHIAAQPEVQVKVSHRYIFPGDEVQLICESSGLVRPMTYWSKEGRLVSKRRDYSFEDNKLVIRNISVNHQGRYYCAASNSVDGVASSGVELYLSGLGIRAPVFDTVRITQTVFEGENVVFICDPRLDTTEGLMISWARTDALPLPEGHVITANNSLMLLNVMTADEGTYRCTATNVLGTAFLEYRLEVESKQFAQCYTYVVSVSHSHFPPFHYYTVLIALDYRVSVHIVTYMCTCSVRVVKQIQMFCLILQCAHVHLVQSTHKLEWYPSLTILLICPRRLWHAGALIHQWKIDFNLLSSVWLFCIIVFQDHSVSCSFFSILLLLTFALCSSHCQQSSYNRQDQWESSAHICARHTRRN